MGGKRTMVLRKRIPGHPIKQDPEVQKLYTVMENACSLVYALEIVVEHEDLLNLQAAANGAIQAYCKLTGIKEPQITLRVYSGSTEAVTRKLFQTTAIAVGLVQTLEKRLDKDTMLILKSSTLGLMHAYASLSGKPAPTEVAREVYEAIVVRELAESKAV